MDLWKIGLTITKEDYEWLDFTIDKTHSAFYDAGKKFEKLFTTYFVLLTVAAILTYGRTVGTDGQGAGIKVPFLDLSLNRHFAAIVVIVLATSIFFSLVCVVVYEETLRWRLEGLIMMRYGKLSEVGDEMEKYWYMSYPSLFRMSVFLDRSYKFGGVLTNIYLLLVLSGLVWPVPFSWHISRELALPLAGRIMLCIAVSILPLLSSYVLITIFPSSRHAAAVYHKLEDHFREQKGSE